MRTFNDSSQKQLYCSLMIILKHLPAKINLYYNETEFISYENNHVDKYKKSYYKLLKVCIPQLRRAHA